MYVLGHEFDEYEGEAVWEDIKLGVRHPASFERMAIVTDASWAGPATKVFSVLWPGQGARLPARRARRRQALGGRQHGRLNASADRRFRRKAEAAALPLCMETSSPPRSPGALRCQAIAEERRCSSFVGLGPHPRRDVLPMHRIHSHRARGHFCCSSLPSASMPGGETPASPQRGSESSCTARLKRGLAAVDQRAAVGVPGGSLPLGSRVCELSARSRRC